MSNFNDIVVKKADGTTNVTFVAFQRSAGDKIPARFQQTSGFPIASNRPSLSIASSNAGNTGLVRKLTVDGIYPIVNLVTGVQIAHVALKGLQILVPLNAPSSDVSEGVHQLLNCVANAVVKSAAIDGTAPA